MGIKIVRTPSETPNITNVDDIIPFRYAYGNQNGYVIGRGSELSGSYESGEFTVGSGRAVIQGVEIDIDANGISTTLDTASETRYFKIYLKVNLANDVTVLESHYSTVSYDEITDPTSSDLISGGDAYLLLYTLQLSGTTQVEKTKIVSQVEYINKNTTIENANKVQNVDLSDDNASQFGDYVVSKKKLLWAGSKQVAGNEIYLSGFDGRVLTNKKIEIIFSLDNYTPDKDNYYSWYTAKFINNSIPQYIYKTDALTGSNSQNSASLSSLFCYLQCFSNNLTFTTGYIRYNLKTGSFDEGLTRPQFTIYAIYEIIE